MKRILVVLFLFLFSLNFYAAEKVKNVVVLVNHQNLSASESVWLPDSVRDKIETNLQLYTDMQLVSSNDKKIRELQKKSESYAYDENTSIELGKLVSASHALFVTVRKTGKSYNVSAEFTNLTTGKLIAKVMSDGRTNPDDLFNITGSVVDLLTIDLCEKLGLPLSNIQKYLLKNGSFELSESGVNLLEMYSQEVLNYEKQIKLLDNQIKLLQYSSDLDDVIQKNKLESEKALAEEKKKFAESNKLRISELEKIRREEEAALEGKTAEVQNKILSVAKSVNSKSIELRQRNMENFSSFGKIRVLESKKAALIEIRNNVRREQALISQQYIKDYEPEIKAVEQAPWRIAEKNDDGTVSKEALNSRKEKIRKIESERDEIILETQKKIAESTYDSQVDVMVEIMLDQKALQQTVFNANTINKNLFVKIGNYGRNIDGWKVSYSVLCDGIELIHSEGVIKYSDLERLVPSGLEKFDAIDMYDSLFKCGEPVLTFNLAYKVSDVQDKVSTYRYEFGDFMAYDTKSVSFMQNGIITGNSLVCGFNGNFTVEKQMRPGNDWMEFANNPSRKEIVSSMADLNMVAIPNKKIEMLATEVTQNLYKGVVGENPSSNVWGSNPVENVSWYDAIYFCNLLSIQSGYEAVYAVNGKTNVAEWNYTPHKGKSVSGTVTQNRAANGFRLPTFEEWTYAAQGGKNSFYSGSNNIEDVAWYNLNSGDRTHQVAQKKPNEYGLYDMSGNVWEWCWDVFPGQRNQRINCGGSYCDYMDYCEVFCNEGFGAYTRGPELGFRIVRNVK